MKSRLAYIEANLAVLHSLLDPLTLPNNFPDYLITIIADLEDHPAVNLNCNTAPNQHGRDKLLSLAGEWFGTDGWVKELSYDNKTFNWKKQKGGVYLKIEGAEKLPIPDSNVPVPPTAFPLMLNEPIVAQPVEDDIPF